MGAPVGETHAVGRIYTGLAASAVDGWLRIAGEVERLDGHHVALYREGAEQQIGEAPGLGRFRVGVAALGDVPAEVATATLAIFPATRAPTGKRSSTLDQGSGNNCL